MLSANQQKFLTSLYVKKYRQMYRKFIVEGEKMVAELFRQSRMAVSAVYGLERWAEANAALLQPFFEKFNLVTEAELKKISALSTPNQVLAVVEMPETPLHWADLRAGYGFYLDGIQDPGNLGAILRVADWFGIRAVYCSSDSVDVYSPKVVQSGMGAFLRVPAYEVELNTLLEQMPGLPLLGAALDGENVFKAALPGHGLLVIGNEGKGMRPATEALLTRRLTIPKAAAGGAESLNAAVATGILAAVLTHAE